MPKVGEPTRERAAGLRAEAAELQQLIIEVARRAGIPAPPTEPPRCTA